MEQFEIKTKVDFLQMEELTETERDLIKEAIEATKKSYAIYSHFQVGAAALLSDGTVSVGANQENAAFPASLCAERIALFAAQTSKPECSVRMLAVAAHNEHGLLQTPISPCGSCRQVIMEIEERYGQPISILLYGTKGIYRISSIHGLLPLAFVDKQMKEGKTE